MVDTNRKKLIEEIMANINAMRNKMHVKIMQSGSKNMITHSQWFVLCLIQQHKNMGIKEISKMLSITSSATTQLVDGLVESGYVERKINNSDRRSLQLVLSKKGQKSIIEMKIEYAKSMETLFKALTDQELETYNILHKKISAFCNC